MKICPICGTLITPKREYWVQCTIGCIKDDWKEPQTNKLLAIVCLDCHNHPKVYEIQDEHNSFGHESIDIV